MCRPSNNISPEFPPSTLARSATARYGKSGKENCCVFAAAWAMPMGRKACWRRTGRRLVDSVADAGGKSGVAPPPFGRRRPQAESQSRQALPADRGGHAPAGADHPPLAAGTPVASPVWHRRLMPLLLRPRGLTREIQWPHALACRQSSATRLRAFSDWRSGSVPN